MFATYTCIASVALSTSRSASFHCTSDSNCRILHRSSESCERQPLRSTPHLEEEPVMQKLRFCSDICLRNSPCSALQIHGGHTANPGACRHCFLP